MVTKRSMRWLPKSTVRRLELTVGFRHMTVDPLHRLEFEGQTRSAVESWLRRTVKGGWFQAERLDDQQVYYRLTHQSVMYLKRFCQKKVSRAATRPLRPNRKFELHALLQFCSQPGAPKRTAYRPSRDSHKFADITAYIAKGHADPLRHKLFYREGEVIGYFVADRGQSRLIQSKLHPKLYSLFFRWESFQELAEAQQFRLSIVTVSQNRRRELIDEFHENVPPVPWEVVVISELRSLLPSLRAATANKERSNGTTP